MSVKCDASILALYSSSAEETSVCSGIGWKQSYLLNRDVCMHWALWLASWFWLLWNIELSDLLSPVPGTVRATTSAASRDVAGAAPAATTGTAGGLCNSMQVRLTFSGRGPTLHLPPPYSIVTYSGGESKHEQTISCSGTNHA